MFHFSFWEARTNDSLTTAIHGSKQYMTTWYLFIKRRTGPQRNSNYFGTHVSNSLRARVSEPESQKRPALYCFKELKPIYLRNKHNSVRIGFVFLILISNLSCFDPKALFVVIIKGQNQTYETWHLIKKYRLTNIPFPARLQNQIQITYFYLKFVF